MCHAHGVTYRLSMAPRVAQRFGVHLRPHMIALTAFMARRLAWLCLVAGALILMSPGGDDSYLPVQASGGYTAVNGTVTAPAVPRGVEVLVPVGESDPVLSVSSSPPGESRLARGATTLGWLSVGAAAWWLGPLLRTFAAGDPFDRGNPRRLRLIALAVLVGTHVAPLLPPLAAHLALDRLGVDGFSPRWGFPVHTPILYVALLLLLAGALRQGRSLQDDMAGLV